MSVWVRMWGLDSVLLRMRSSLCGLFEVLGDCDDLPDDVASLCAGDAQGVGGGVVAVFIR